MIVNEEDFDGLVEAVENAQMRLADTFMIRVLAQLLDTVEEMHGKVEQMYEFLSSDDDETTKADTEAKSAKEEVPTENSKPAPKTKQTPKVSEENNTELKS